jgi:hypothetical protein
MVAVDGLSSGLSLGIRPEPQQASRYSGDSWQQRAG